MMLHAADDLLRLQGQELDPAAPKTQAFPP